MDWQNCIQCVGDLPDDEEEVEFPLVLRNERNHRGKIQKSMDNQSLPSYHPITPFKSADNQSLESDYHNSLSIEDESVYTVERGKIMSMENEDVYKVESEKYHGNESDNNLGKDDDEDGVLVFKPVKKLSKTLEAANTQEKEPEEESTVESSAASEKSERHKICRWIFTREGILSIIMAIILLLLVIILTTTLGRNQKEDKYLSAGNSGNSEVDGAKAGNSSSSGTMVWVASPQDSQISPQSSTNQAGGASSTNTFVDSLSLAKSVRRAYYVGEEIRVPFTYGPDMVPSVNDLVGLFPSSTPASDLQRPPWFLYLCNEPFPCKTTISNGTVVFGPRNSTDGSWSWPLPAGEYKAYLLRSKQPPYEEPPFMVLGGSDTFDVMDPAAVLESINGAANAIRSIVTEDDALGPKFVRLGFHDCVGGCDGCVDLTLLDNAGLDIPINALDPVVSAHENLGIGFSRADIWALAALIGADVAQEESEVKVDFSLKWVGRKNCEHNPSGVCLDADGNPRECSPVLGPHRVLPEADITTSHIFHFFNEEFGFTDKEIVALMGAHTLGSMNRENSGFDAKNGWVRNNRLLDNDYYVELVGGQFPNASVDELRLTAPPWLRTDIDNSDLPGIPSRRMWKAFPPSEVVEGETEEIGMLNADIALVRELDETNMDQSGRVNCVFIPGVNAFTPTCLHAERSIGFAAEYKFNNTLWLHDFEIVYKKMLVHGYDTSSGCMNDAVCGLR